MNLVIVESPAKAKTIEKYLGKDYKVLASFGHVRDLPEDSLGIDVEHDFEPDYVIPAKSKKIVALLKKEAGIAELIFLATDLDREGEAIAWHIACVLKSKKPMKRITFHEITKDAILDAVEHPREINDDLVDAQQARRVLDRLVGYKLSPLLWRKVAKGLSAGRVQSVTVRLIVDREREIQAFKPEEYWSVSALFKEGFQAQLSKIDSKKIEKLEIINGEQAEDLKKKLENAQYSISSVETKDTFRYPSPPFTTSTLQMDASRKLGFSAKKTMTLAQLLYEGADLGEEGSVGLITYMRTDSVNIAESAISEIRSEITKHFGSEYLSSETRRFKAKSKGAQEAHEAIRPTSAKRRPELVEGYLEPDMFRLYELIWRRAVATQMKEAKFESTAVDIEAGNFEFHATGSKMVFPGFIQAYIEGRDEEDEEKENILPNLQVGQKLDLDKILSEQHFTEPPPRYSEATLVKALEEHGIGRPSTYAPTMSTIQDRGYVIKENKYFKPQEIGIIVNDLLVKHFPNIVDINFTAHMEDDLDEIAEGKKAWVPVIREFYVPFEKEIEVKMEEIKKSEVLQAEPTGEVCDKCGKEMVIRIGKYGKFMSCSGFPDCKNIKNLNPPPTEQGTEALPVEVQEMLSKKCELCGGELVLRHSKFGKFIGCSAYPKCKNIIQLPGAKPFFRKKFYKKKK